MKLMLLLLLAISALLLSCANMVNEATRYAFDPGEGIYSYSYETSQTQDKAFYLAEEWLSINIKDANKVISLRQPATGVLIANPTISVPVSLTSYWGHYTLKITCLNNKVTALFTMGMLEVNAYPPRNAMPYIESEFKSLSLGLLAYLNAG